MSSADSTIKVRTIADLGELKKWVEGLNSAKDAVSGLEGAAGSASGGASHATAASGSPPAAPGGPGAAQAGPGSGNPPPPPVQTATGPATGAAGDGAESGAPPPVPTPPAPQAPQPQVPPAPAQDDAGRWRNPNGSFANNPDATGDAEVDAARLAAERFGRARGAMGMGKTVLATAAGTAAGLGLGQSFSGFFMSAGHKYLALSRVIAQVEQRFRSAKEEVHGFGSALGYTITQTAGFLDAQGEQSNSVTRADFSRTVGMSRFMGQDPRSMINSFGTIERASRTGEQGQRKLTDEDMAAKIGVAIGMEMDEGRFGEFMQSAASLNMQMLSSVGFADDNTVSALQRMAFDVFSGGEKGKGQKGADFIGRLNEVLTSKGPMASFLMRAIGYGSEGSDMGYIEMRKRQEAGLFDPRNLAAVFQGFNQRGLDSGGQFKALENVAGGRLKATEIEKLVSVMGAPGAAETLMEWSKDNSYGTAQWLKNLTPDELAIYQQTNDPMAALGRSKVSLGEARGVTLESASQEVGAVVATTMVDMQEALFAAAGGLEDLLGIPWGELITTLSGGVKDLVVAVRKITGDSDFVEDGGVLGAVKRPAQAAGRAYAAHNVGGMNLLWDELVYSRFEKLDMAQYLQNVDTRILVMHRNNGGSD